jgi:hypothetical protein
MSHFKNRAQQLSRRDFLKAVLTGGLAVSGVAAGYSALRTAAAGSPAGAGHQAGAACTWRR